MSTYNIHNNENLIFTTEQKSGMFKRSGYCQHSNKSKIQSDVEKKQSDKFIQLQ